MIHRRAFLNLLLASTGAVLVGCKPEVLPPAEATLVKGPYVQVMDPTLVRVVFETLEDVEVLIRVRGPNGSGEARPRRQAAFRTLGHGTAEGPEPVDAEGVHVAHELLMTGLTAGGLYVWEIEPMPGEVVSGSFIAPPLPTAATSIAFLSGTRQPVAVEVCQMLAAEQPDLVLLGGDLQHRDDPDDTWNGLFQSLQPLCWRAPIQVAFGEHERDVDGEAEQYFDWLFAQQGGSSSPRTHLMPWGRLVVLFLDSESADLGEPDGSHEAFADRILALAVEGGLTPILVVHRPPYTLCEAAVEPDLAQREAVARLVDDHGVRLVLSGHTGGYERFDVRGCAYVVDGGGGVPLQDLDAGIEAVAALRPEEPELRQAASSTHGGLVLDVGPASITVRRLDLDSRVVDELTIEV